jgi:hypothetical protein
MYAPDVGYEAPLKANRLGHFIFSTSLFILATCSASTFFIFGQRELFGREAGWRTFFYLPFLMSLGVGLGLNNAKAVFEAIWGAIKKKPSEFIRTPKYGMTGGQRTWRQAPKFLTFKKLWLPLLEIGMGCYMLMCICISILWNFGQASIPFLLIFAGGYFYVGFSSVYTLYKMNQEAEEAMLAAEGVEVVEPAST